LTDAKSIFEIQEELNAKVNSEMSQNQGRRI